MLHKVFISVIVVNYVFNNNANAVIKLDFDSNRYPFDRQLHEDVLDPELCQRQLDFLTTDFGLLARFLDAGIRPPRGVLDGNLVDLGNFHQCLDINEQVEDMEINGKYCRIQVPLAQDIQLPIQAKSLVNFDLTTLQVDKNIIRQLEAQNRLKVALKSDFLHGLRTEEKSPLANLSFNLAVCIPRPCSTEQAINGLLFNVTDVGFEFSDVSCRLPDDRPWAAADYVAIVVFSIIGFLTIISTVYDLYQSKYLRKDSKNISPAYTSFSVYTNTRRLLTFNSSPGSLECLDGIRALAMMWVIIGHSFFAVSNMVNPIEAVQWITSARAVWITAAPITVDTFFLLSGLLLVYTTAGKFGRMQLLENLHVFYLHRLLRLFPILAIVILFEASLFMRVADGPSWENVGLHVFKCRELWWSTLLHLQNFLNPQEACISVAWYIAIDVHLHILSPIILFWVLTSKRAAWTALNTGLIVVLTASTVFVFFQNFPSGAISQTRPDEMIDYYVYFYMNILTRASPFLVGMIYGYILHLWSKKKIQMPKILTSFLLLCFLLTMLGVIYCSYLPMRLDWDNQLADNFFNSFMRPVWALALGWLIFACVQGRAEPINWFLSLPMWKLPARITYAMYLTHFSIMVGYYSSLVSPVHFNVPFILFNCMAFIFMTIIISFFVTLLIDSPFSTIFKLLLSRGKKVSKPPKITIAENGTTTDGNTNAGYSFEDEDMRREDKRNL